MALFLEQTMAVCFLIFHIYTTHSSIINFQRVAELRKFDEINLPRKTKVHKYLPGSRAEEFSILTLNGTLDYKSGMFNETSPILIHSFNWESAFLQCLWNCTNSLEDLVRYSPENTYYIFMSQSPSALASFHDALWMRRRVYDVATHILDKKGGEKFVERCHFVIEPAPWMKERGCWIPDLLDDWSCEDHNCGIDQVVLASESTSLKLVMPRLDARYDWLPSPSHVLTNQSYSIADAGLGCNLKPNVKGAVALVASGNCSYFTKVRSMEKSGAVAVLVTQDEWNGFKDMNCLNDEECHQIVNIPASMIPPVLVEHIRLKDLKVQYRTKPSENFFTSIDHDGNLSEVGWFLQPSFRHLNWQADWLNYRKELDLRLKQESLNLIIFNDQSVMDGGKGVSINYTFNNISALKDFNKLELDMQLSCKGPMDADCPHWDRTIQLFVTCNSFVAQEVEFGRWISPFRRRVGRWLTDVSPLLAILPDDESTCTFTFTGALDGEFWMPRLSLRLSHSEVTNLRPLATFSWIKGTFNFNKYYNNFLPYKFYIDDNYKAVKIYSVITGHGSDEYDCAEFCVTSHHFVVNGRLYNETFFNAGTPLGCAEQTRSGVEPNEHGTWLYGRNGWCDGKEVEPWVIDISNDLELSKVNTIDYFGLFRGAQPSPKSPGAVIVLQVYVVFYG